MAIRLSIIVPVYNVAPYLRESLDSIAAAIEQCRSRSFEFGVIDVEVLCIDDCSTDGSAEILDEFAATHHSLFVVHHFPENRGVSAARNRGLEVATGEVVMFMDPDDTVGPGWIAALVAGLKDADVAWGGYQRDGVEVLPRDVGARYAGEAAVRRIWRAVFGYRMRNLWKVLLPGGLWRNCGRELGGVWCRAFRREVLAGVRFDERLRLYEDAMFLAKVALRVRRLQIVGDASYRYRNRPDGALAVEGATRLLANKFAMRDVRREIDPMMTHWRGTRVLAFLEVWKLAGWRTALRYWRFEEAPASVM